MTDVDKDDIKHNYDILVTKLYNRLVQLGKQDKLHDYRLQVTEERIRRLSTSETVIYYVWASNDSKYYHPKLVLEFNWRTYRNGDVRFYIPYSVKRFSKKFNLLTDIDDFDSIIDKNLDVLEQQWNAYQETELNIRNMFVSLDINEISYTKHNVWNIKFNNTQNQKIAPLSVWYNTKTNLYTLQHTGMNNLVLLNEILTNFRT